MTSNLIWASITVIYPARREFLMCVLQVRSLTNMCSVPLDLFSMLELGGQQPSSAMISMNQLTTGHHLANRRTGRKKTTGIPNPKRMFEEVTSCRTAT